MLSTLLGESRPYLNLLFQQPIALLGLAYGFLAYYCGPWSQWQFNYLSFCGAVLVCLVYLMPMWFPVPLWLPEGVSRAWFGLWWVPSLVPWGSLVGE